MNRKIQVFTQSGWHQGSYHHYRHINWYQLFTRIGNIFSIIAVIVATYAIYQIIYAK